MVRLAERLGSALCKLIVQGPAPPLQPGSVAIGMSNVIRSSSELALAAAIASRKEQSVSHTPSAVSVVLVTTRVAVMAAGAATDPGAGIGLCDVNLAASGTAAPAATMEAKTSTRTPGVLLAPNCLADRRSSFIRGT